MNSSGPEEKDEKKKLIEEWKALFSNFETKGALEEE